MNRKSKRLIALLFLLIAAGFIIAYYTSDADSKPAGATDDKPGASATASSKPSSSASPSVSPSSPITKNPGDTSTSSPSTSPEPSTSPTPTDPGFLIPEQLAAEVSANLPDDHVTEKNGLAIVTNLSSTLLVVNKVRNLPADYVPDDLVVPEVAFSFSGEDQKKQLRKPAARALEELFAAANNDKIDLKAVSGYRSYNRQKTLFDNYTNNYGLEEANRFSARPGQSEHQTGLAMDVSSASVKYGLEQSYGDTKEGKWLAQHAAEYGFIIRYPQDKEDITGYMYEPWHLRYVGKDLAKEIADSNLTLEEYFNQAAEVLAQVQ